MGTPGLSQAQRASVVALVVAGKTMPEIAVLTGIGYRAVYTFVKASGLSVTPAPLGPPKGCRNYCDFREPTDADLDAMIAEQLRCLPSWWARDVAYQEWLEFGDTPDLQTAATQRHLSVIAKKGRELRRTVGREL